MKKIIFLLCILVMALNSCKKKTTPTPTTRTNPQNGTYGVLKCEKIYTYSSSTHTVYFSGNKATSYFSDNPNFSNFVAVTSVYVDSVRLKFDNLGGPLYYDTTYQLVFNPAIVWRVAGLNSIPSFTLTDTDSFPSYSGYATLPDTIYRNQNLVVPLTGVSNNSDATVELMQGSNMIMQPNIGAGNCTITVPTNSLTPLSPGYATLAIVCNKYMNFSESGKGFLFAKSCTVEKSVYLK